MTRTLKEAALTTPNARLRLKAGLHWRAIDAEIHLGYRKASRVGRWVVRWYRGSQAYSQATIGTADDEAPADGGNVYNFHQAKNAAVDIVTRKRAEAAIAASGEIPTVGSAVESYMEMRDARQALLHGSGKSDARRRLTRHVLSNSALCEVQLHTLTTDHFRKWLAGLPRTLKGPTVRRLCNDLKAALNAAAVAEADRMPADLPAKIRTGLTAGEDSQAVARDKQALPDADIRRIIEAAKTVDARDGHDGDLFRMVLVLAATGARFSQVRRLTVSDVQPAQRRIMVPASRKGRGNKKVTHVAVRVGADVIDALHPETVGRLPSDPLLLRWRHRQEGGDDIRRPQWVRDERAEWRSAAELTRPWQEVLAEAGLPATTVPYALRHSSIVRQLRKGLPVQLVAKSHDTSAAMIETHYSAAIVDALDDLSAAAVIPLDVPKPDNVVTLRG